MFNELLCLEHYNRRGKTFFTFGMDSPERCLDTNWYKSFNKNISYDINENGFRDKNHTEFQNQYFVIGDSFTFGMGQPYNETWPAQLETLLNAPIVKLAVDGAGNDWIRLTFEKIVKFKPKAVFIMLSFVHRELNFNNDFIVHLHYNEEQFEDLNWSKSMLQKTEENLQEIKNISSQMNIPVFFSAVPYFDIASHSDKIRKEVVPYRRLFSTAPLEIYQKFSDLARDGFHFGEKTSKEIAINFHQAYKKG